MAMERDGTKYIIRVFYREVGKTGNVVTHNCDTLDQAWGRIARLRSDPKVFKMELCSIIESFTTIV